MDELCGSLITRHEASEGDSLSDGLLRLANSGVPRVDFLRKVCELLVASTGCSTAVMWARENGSCARCTSGHGLADGFEFEVVACPRVHGEEDVLVDEDLLCGFSGDEWPCGADPLNPKLSMITGSTDGLPSALGTGIDATRSDSFVLVPLSIGGEMVGRLLLLYGQPEAIGSDDVEALKALARSCAVAMVNQRSQAALRERVKELTGLYSLSRLADQPGISQDELLQGIAELLPPAWQYPEIAVGRVVLDGRSYASGRTEAGISRQRAEIAVEGSRRGFVEIEYVEPRPDLDEGPFLTEERSLLDTIAREVAAIIERRQAADERERLQDQLLHADRLATIGQLAAGVAHELNEPLGAVLGFAQLARKHEQLPSAVDDDIRKIEAAALNARETVRKLMVFARQTPPRKAPVNLNQLVEDGLYLVEARCVEGQIEVEKQLAHGLPDIVADGSQLQQVFINLVVNAIHAMPEGGQLTIATEDADHHVVLRVTDSGFGMDDEVSRRAFLPFFTTKDISEGTGLGLAVVHGIVSSHGGRVGVSSRPGEGSCFEVEMPKSDTHSVGGRRG